MWNRAGIIAHYRVDFQFLAGDCALITALPANMLCTESETLVAPSAFNDLSVLVQATTSIWFNAVSGASTVFVVGSVCTHVSSCSITSGGIASSVKFWRCKSHAFCSHSACLPALPLDQRASTVLSILHLFLRLVLRRHFFLTAETTRLAPRFLRAQRATQQSRSACRGCSEQF